MKFKERIGKWLMEKEDKRRKRKSNGGLEKRKQEDRERGELKHRGKFSPPRCHDHELTD